MGQMSLLRRLYNWTIERAATKQAERGLFAVSFAESSFFPIPPDIMLVPMTLARPERAWYLAWLTTVASVLGGLLGYAIGYFLYDTVGLWIINTYGLEDTFAAFQMEFAKWGFLVILLKGLTPIPYKLVTIASGIAAFPLWQFVIASMVARGGRFFLLALLLRYFGDRARVFIEKYLPWCTLALAALVVLGFWLAIKIA